MHQCDVFHSIFYCPAIVSVSLKTFIFGTSYPPSLYAVCTNKVSALISFSLLPFVLIVHVYSVIEQASSVSSGLLAIIGTLNLSTQFIHSITSGSHCLKKPSRPSLAVLLVPSLITAMLECQNWISPGYKYRTRWRASYKVRTHNATVKELLWLAV